MHNYALWVKESTATTGTGAITLGGAVTGFTTFASQVTPGQTVLYAVVDGNNRELGVGTLTNATTLTRTTVRATLTGGTFASNPANGLNLSGNAEVAVTADAVLLEWAESIRQSTGHDGETLVVGGSGIAALSGVLDGGVV